MTTTEEPATCWECERELDAAEVIAAVRRDEDEPLCESCIDNANEEAWLSQASDYYGGDGPVTVREQQTKAWEGKR